MQGAGRVSQVVEECGGQRINGSPLEEVVLKR